MSKFFENIRERIKKVPSLITKRLVKVSILGDTLEFTLRPIKQNQTLKQYLENLIIKVNEVIVYDASTHPFDYDVKLNERIYPNRELLKIYDRSLKVGEKLGLIVPNRPNVTPGFYNIVIATHSEGVKANFNKYFSLAPEETNIPTRQTAKTELYSKCKNCGEKSSDPNQIICEYCGFQLKE